MDRGYEWLTASGLADRDVTDDHDFRLTTYAPPPAWAAEAVVYEVFPDRFARSGNAVPLPEWATERQGMYYWREHPRSARRRCWSSSIPQRTSQYARILYMTTVPLAEARQNFSALVDEAVATHQRVLVTRNGVPVVWMISDEDFESIMETLDVLADAAAMQDVSQSRADSAAGRYVTAPEMEKIMAARAEGIDLGDDANVVADMHARGLPDSVCMSTLEALISLRRQQAR